MNLEEKIAKREEWMLSLNKRLDDISAELDFLRKLQANLQQLPPGFEAREFEWCGTKQYVVMPPSRLITASHHRLLVDEDSREWPWVDGACREEAVAAFLAWQEEHAEPQ